MGVAEALAIDAKTWLGVRFLTQCRATLRIRPPCAGTYDEVALYQRPVWLERGLDPCQ
jgi:hypothetical protein